MYVCDYCKKSYNKKHGLLTHLGQYDPCKTLFKTEKISALKQSAYVECKICGIKKRKLMHYLKKYHSINTIGYKHKYGGEVICLEDREKSGKHLEKMRNILWKTEEFKNIHSSKIMGKKISDSLKKYYAENPDVIEKLSIHKCNNPLLGNKSFKRGWYWSTKNHRYFYYHSGFELKIMNYLDRNGRVLNWEKNMQIKIPYLYKGKKKNYIYDFKIQLEAGILVLESKQFPDKKFIYKLYGLDSYCRINKLHFGVCRDLSTISSLFSNFNDYVKYRYSACGQGTQVH